MLRWTERGHDGVPTPTVGGSKISENNVKKKTVKQKGGIAMLPGKQSSQGGSPE